MAKGKCSKGVSCSFKTWHKQKKAEVEANVIDWVLLRRDHDHKAKTVKMKRGATKGNVPKGTSPSAKPNQPWCFSKLKGNCTKPTNSDLRNLARLLFLPLSTIYVNQVLFSFDESPYCTIPIRSWASQTRILNLYNPSKMSSGWIFIIDNRIPSHFESNSWISSFRRIIVNRSA